RCVGRHHRTTAHGAARTGRRSGHVNRVELVGAGVLVNVDGTERGDRRGEGAGHRVGARGNVLRVEDLGAPVASPGRAPGGTGVAVASAVGQRYRTSVAPEHVDDDQVAGGVRAAEGQ